MGLEKFFLVQKMSKFEQSTRNLWDTFNMELVS